MIRESRRIENCVSGSRSAPADCCSRNNRGGSLLHQDTMGSTRIKSSPSSSSSLLMSSSHSSLASAPGFARVILVLLSISTCLVLGGYPPSSYYPVKKYPYLPAPPGETPNCAKHGATFCEKIETYPTEVVSYLLYKYGSTYQQFLKSESDRDFLLISQTYGPPTGGYEGGYSSPHDKHYNHNNNHNSYNNNNGNSYQNYNNQSSSGGYSFYRPNHNNNNHNNNNRYQREYGGYGGNGGNGGGNYQFAAAAMPPPMIQSMWWNHRDTVTNRPAYPYLQQQQQNHRGGYSRKKRQASDGQLCPTRSNFIAPQAAMNNEGNWMYVVNLDDPRYLQMVRAEFCANGDGSPCNGVCNVGPGVRASCRQKYVQKRLVALDGSGERFLNDVFWFAHCCVCQVN